MFKYSIAIRTLARNPDTLRQELVSIKMQSIKPEKVVIYIAEGCPIPDFRICEEGYVVTQKGMLSQRALDYEEIDTPLLLLLDDDVLLAPDSVEKMIDGLTSDGYDCLGADVFEIHKMSLGSRLYAALSNITLPHFDTSFAIKIKDHGSFSYLTHPTRPVVDSQSASGPCSLWRKDALLSIRLKDEQWIDSMGYPFNEDTLLFYKLYCNGGKLGFMYDSGVVHLDGRTSSESYHKDKKRFLIRAKTQYILWHRMIYIPSNHSIKRMRCVLAFLTKSLCMIPVHIAASIRFRDIKIPILFIKGIIEGISYTNSQEYKALKPYVFNANK